MKAGVKSTEFWMHILMAAAGGAYQAAAQSEDPTVLVALQLVAALYTAARTFLKARQPVGAPTSSEPFKDTEASK